MKKNGRIKQHMTNKKIKIKIMQKKDKRDQKENKK